MIEGIRPSGQRKLQTHEVQDPRDENSGPLTAEGEEILFREDGVRGYGPRPSLSTLSRSVGKTNEDRTHPPQDPTLPNDENRKTRGNLDDG